MFVLFILGRILFITSMIFILVYVFGNSPKSLAFTRLTRAAAVTAIVVFIASNIAFVRGARGWRHDGDRARQECSYFQRDSTRINQ